jgi:hypothetical protein
MELEEFPYRYTTASGTYLIYREGGRTLGNTGSPGLG